jgi:hypothetical protein
MVEVEKVKEKGNMKREEIVGKGKEKSDWKYNGIRKK